jgi:hypothetical protein
MVAFFLEDPVLPSAGSFYSLVTYLLCETLQMNKFTSSYLDRTSRNQKTETYLKQKKVVLSENKDTREHVFTFT